VTLENLITRDGETCIWCGRELWRKDLTAEHLLPKARSGRGVPENLAVACRRCNRRRRTKSAAAYVRAQIQSGARPRIDLLTESLERLSRSSSSLHAQYAQRQLALLRRL
jgi:5-methylcytosine-specific restriction endonuclease McrA